MSDRDEQIRAALVEAKSLVVGAGAHREIDKAIALLDPPKEEEEEEEEGPKWCVFLDMVSTKSDRAADHKGPIDTTAREAIADVLKWLRPFFEAMAISYGSGKTRDTLKVILAKMDEVGVGDTFR